MPVHKVKGGYQWGSKGKVYKTKKEAAKQGRAAYANGYRGDMPTPPQKPPSEGSGMPTPENAGPKMPEYKRPKTNTPTNMGQEVPNDLSVKTDMPKPDKDGDYDCDSYVPMKRDVAGNNARAYQNPALPSDPIQPMPVPADPPKSTQNRGGQPASMPDPPISSWGEGPGKNRWPTLAGSGLAGGSTKIG